MEILMMAVLGIIVYVIARMAMKEPILPWKDKKSQGTKFTKKQEKKKKHNVELDEEPSIFQDLLHDVKEIKHHMIRHHDDTFIMFAEVEPVNYFLLSDKEQEAIDVTMETWLSQVNYNVKPYLQNRFIDLSDPIEEMRQNMMKAEDLHENALEYGKSMVDDLTRWQAIAPRYETKRYLIFSYKVKVSDITADDKEEFENKIIDKAFAELYRRVNTAKSQLRKARMYVELLPDEGILDVLYHTFNRRKAVRNRFKDFGANEMLALYVTADQDDTRIELVKEAIENEFSEEEIELKDEEKSELEEDEKAS
ncbi:hypothetical protein [Pseudalkalibacillus hwajinpoensis]|uniref:hypothetical protein n=1 Tax=Guptibacillus hwajinpoensis TaxID=208199 RepID=UPI001F55869D|nr:hypothetical protein [Pseudalkalibacillus hwajinpoensis]